MRSLSHYNVIVAGGGPAGIIAAIAAARNGASTLLIEQDSFLGGTAATGLPLLAFHNNRGEQIVGGLPWEFVSTLLETDDAAVIRNVITDGNLGKGGSEFIAQSIPVRPEAVKYYAQRMLSDAGADVLLQTFTGDVVVDGGKIKGIGIANKDGNRIISADCVVDCTGDGDIAARAGALFEKGRIGDSIMQPMTQLFVLSDVDLDAAEHAGVSYPRRMEFLTETSWKVSYRKADIKLTPWAEELKKQFPDSGIDRGFIIRYWGDGVYYAGNMLHIPYFDGSSALKRTKAMCAGKDQIWRLVRFLRKNIPGFEKSYLIQTYHIGIRETRRILGEYYLTIDDVLDAKRHDDDVTLSGYFVDIHDYKGDWLFVPDKGTQVKDFGAYGIPYRCLVPQKIGDLLIAGRCLSASHAAHASARVMGTCMAMGQAAGTAAALSTAQGISPRDIDRNVLLQTLTSQGAIVR